MDRIATATVAGRTCSNGGRTGTPRRGRATTSPAWARGPAARAVSPPGPARPGSSGRGPTRERPRRCRSCSPSAGPTRPGPRGHPGGAQPSVVRAPGQPWCGGNIRAAGTFFLSAGPHQPPGLTLAATSGHSPRGGRRVSRRSSRSVLGPGGCSAVRSEDRAGWERASRTPQGRSSCRWPAICTRDPVHGESEQRHPLGVPGLRSTRAPAGSRSTSCAVPSGRPR